jgi:ribosomal protein S18 acetylase RimI-like enzyme
MQFELSKALMDDILFSMEDQNQEFFVDAREGVLVSREDIDESGGERGERFIPLPEWDSSEGYRLMERFAAGFRNPVVREDLTGALNRGKGVFRAFKNVLSAHPESERLWFAFKDREMKKSIIRWYNAFREEWGLERIGMEPEETGDLVREDFRFRGPQPEDTARAEELHRRCREEYREYAGKNGLTGALDLFFAENSGDGMFPGALSLVAETGAGDFAAYISSIRKDSCLYIAALEVAGEYRGLGLGEALLSRLVAAVDPAETSAVLVDLPVNSEGFSRVLLREAFKPYACRYSLLLPET